MGRHPSEWIRYRDSSIGSLKIAFSTTLLTNSCVSRFSWFHLSLSVTNHPGTPASFLKLDIPQCIGFDVYAKIDPFADT